jgi:arylamine N-acetyltransferase
VDAGFGGHVLGTPLRLEPGLVQDTPTGRQRITLAADGLHAVEAELADGWSALYRFTLEPQLPIDYEPLNWFTATRPDSIFRHNLLLERLTPGLRASMLNDRLTLRPTAHATTQATTQAPTVRRVETEADFAQVLADVFDLQPPVSADELFERIPKRHEGMFMPSAGA